MSSVRGREIAGGGLFTIYSGVDFSSPSILLFLVLIILLSLFPN
jgi:hypothetical protein